MEFPASLQGILWSKNFKKLNLQKDKIYIIHQVLSVGSLKEIQWLFKTFTKSEIAGVFKNFPQKIYTRSKFNFVKNFILDINERLDEKKYFKSPS